MTPVAQEASDSPGAGIDLGTFLDKEVPINLATLDFDPQPAPPLPPVVKPKPNMPAFVGLKPSAPQKEIEREEIEEEKYYYTVSHKDLRSIKIPSKFC